MYHSIIIEESLKNPEVLKNYKILRTKFSAGENWHLHIIEIPEPEKAIQEIQEAMVSEKPYYFHIYNEGKTLIIIFKDKIFYLDPNDQSTQLDFYPSEISKEDDWYNRE